MSGAELVHSRLMVSCGGVAKFNRQLCHRGNLRDINVIYVISPTKFAVNSVAHDSASVSRLVSTAAVANFVGSCCGCDLKLCIVSIM